MRSPFDMEIAENSTEDTTWLHNIQPLEFFCCNYYLLQLYGCFWYSLILLIGDKCIPLVGIQANGDFFV